MNSLFLLIPLGLLLLAAAIWAFFWATGSGQFDDMDTPAWSVVMDDDSAPPQQRDATPAPPEERNATSNGRDA